MTAQLKNYTKGVFNDTTDSRKIQHYVTVYGWGVENDVAYWKVQNSWGYYWGESGNFRIVRGKNNLAIETECSYGIPKDTWTQDIRNKTPLTGSNHIPTVTILQDPLPSATFDWRNPINYLTPDRSDTTPTFC